MNTRIICIHCGKPVLAKTSNQHYHAKCRMVVDAKRNERFCREMKKKSRTHPNGRSALTKFEKEHHLRYSFWLNPGHAPNDAMEIPTRIPRRSARSVRGV